MILSEKVLRAEERAVYKMRELYGSYGYLQYKVSKFEEYDLYAKNKSFLVSDKLLTFTDTNGKLMALKPDVTLSIIKNVVANEKASYKVYYDERVYRTTASGDGFGEIMQTGLESIGNIDAFAQSEVVMLAMKSLEGISEDYLLDISNMSFLEGLLESAGVDADVMPDFLALIGSKNVPAIKMLCSKCGISEENTDRICKASSMYLPIKSALDAIKPLLDGEKMQVAYDELYELYLILSSYGLTDKLYVDFSIVNDMNYYDGIIFKGFINGIFDSVLSGGRYDRLMEKLGKKMGAIGFAVYLDQLERFGASDDGYDVDVLLLYNDDTPVSKVISAVNRFRADGKSVRATNTLDKSVSYKKLFGFGKDGIESLEEND
jgi:ATP phosphoribosyltransferase regulatory subunit